MEIERPDNRYRLTQVLQWWQTQGKTHEEINENPVIRREFVRLHKKAKYRYETECQKAEYEPIPLVISRCIVVIGKDYTKCDEWTI